MQMLILSTTRLTAEIERQLQEQYKDYTFRYMENIKAAQRYLKDADILLTYGNDIAASDIEKAKSLKWIMVLSAGIDEMPLEVIKQRQILLTNVRHT